MTPWLIWLISAIVLLIIEVFTGTVAALCLSVVRFWQLSRQCWAQASYGNLWWLQPVRCCHSLSFRRWCAGIS